MDFNATQQITMDSDTVIDLQATTEVEIGSKEVDINADEINLN